MLLPFLVSTHFIRVLNKIKSREVCLDCHLCPPPGGIDGRATAVFRRIHLTASLSVPPSNFKLKCFAIQNFTFPSLNLGNLVFMGVTSLGCCWPLPAPVSGPRPLWWRPARPHRGRLCWLHILRPFAEIFSTHSVCFSQIFNDANIKGQIFNTQIFLYISIYVLLLFTIILYIYFLVLENIHITPKYSPTIYLSSEILKYTYTYMFSKIFSHLSVCLRQIFKVRSV